MTALSLRGLASRRTKESLDSSILDARTIHALQYAKTLRTDATAGELLCHSTVEANP